MAATVLKSQRAIQMSVFVVRAFVQMREALVQNHQIMTKLGEIERRLENHETDIGELVRAVRGLMAPPPASRRKIGFQFPAQERAAASRSRMAV